MKLKHLSDSKLIDSTHFGKKLESQATTNVVRHFVEIYRRNLYLARGFSSMFLMARDEFGYDKTSAQRRVHAMELALKVPSILEKIDQGLMYLQSVADIQSFLNAERGQRRPYSDQKTRELVELCAGLSCREVEMELMSRNPQLDFKESKKLVSKDQMRVTYTSRLTIEEKVQRIKELRSHINPYMNRDELMDYMAEIVLDKIDPARKDARAEKREMKKAELEEVEVSKLSVPAQKHDAFEIPVREEAVGDVGEIQLAVDFDAISANDLKPAHVSASEPKRTRYIKASEQRTVRKFNQNRGCNFTDHVTGRRCGSKHQEQLDHIQGYSHGGSNKPENLQFYCARHNRFRWRQSLRSLVRSGQPVHERIESCGGEFALSNSEPR